MQVRETPPFAPVLMESTRAIGYSLEAAIADIIDNSIAAKAGKVQLSFFPVGDAYVSILDNGTGLSMSGLRRLRICLQDAHMTLKLLCILAFLCVPSEVKNWPSL